MQETGNDIAAMAARIKALRRTTRLSQTQLAERLGTRQSVVSRWEKGKHIPDDVFIEKLAELSGLSTAQFRYGKDDGKSDGLMPRTAWGRRMTDHLEAALKMARKSDQRDVAGALSILLEKCLREEAAEREQLNRRK